MISISELKKSYRGAVAVDITQLDIPAGESFGLVGNNGAGKTTLFRIILDLIRPDSGIVMIEGANVRTSEEWKKHTGSFIDEKFLIDYLTPEEYFGFLAKIYGLTDQDLQVHLSKFEVLFNNEILGKRKYIRDLSKGNKKKVGIAAAFIGNPAIVMLDEPFENLDPTSQIHLKRIIHESRSEKTFLISSHDLNHVTDICTRIVLLEKGKVLLDEQVNEQTLFKLNDYFSGNVNSEAT
ncbi:ABC transporter ATP-binding protein [Fulvivirga sedimenti]|uniref:ATP-binding cassette domain-containing protein n=1 Tax=Fulvivirga sedimenti TaxID=2879465 RepID=A0A9X1HVU2_9BACT|nr:ATP-binding cassette domain-containing protein [Fulvivirga sedimenti]MCA6078801.1 ATP-binding cassette domain-containing protein [Fulvivirga sedimenti]